MHVTPQFPERLKTYDLKTSEDFFNGLTLTKWKKVNSGKSNILSSGNNIVRPDVNNVCPKVVVHRCSSRQVFLKFSQI